MARFRVIAEHRRIYETPIVAKAGDRVTPRTRDDDEPGWIWCEHGVSGLAGWVPEAFLEIDGSQASLRQDYNAMELNVDTGDLVIVIQEWAGWSLCVLADRSTGWVPSGNLQAA